MAGAGRGALAPITRGIRGRLMRRVALLLISFAVLLASACATAPPAPPAPPTPAVNVTGNWAGTWWIFDGEGGSGRLSGTLFQEGAVVNGEFTVSGRVVNTTFVAGNVYGNELRLSTPAPGRLIVNGDEMTGVVYGLAQSRLTLRRQP